MRAINSIARRGIFILRSFPIIFAFSARARDLRRLGHCFSSSSSASTSSFLSPPHSSTLTQRHVNQGHRIHLLNPFEMPRLLGT
ncbi:hypothetical protein F4821DRAFT_172577 [Hypoxylon rubiginosum]|uniref:Uncharacterized protein n=1 Tax=Hypoxylon rubiginosum TaxID=110542 RepID=A0ACC0DHD6_9PEZI|nr:hypothetical protein F4821DRAFT_172577 [Hypoxylon rubiginosum]